MNEKKIIVVLVLLLTILSLCGCESEVDRAQREYEEAAQRAEEAQQKSDEAREKVKILENFLDLTEKTEQDKICCIKVQIMHIEKRGIF